MKTCLRAQTDLFYWNDYYWAANVLLAEVTDGGTFHQQARPGSPSLRGYIAMDSSPHASHQQDVARNHVWQKSIIADQSLAKTRIHSLPCSHSYP